MAYFEDIPMTLATTGLLYSQHGPQHRPLHNALERPVILIYDEAQLDSSIGDLAMLNILPSKCLLIRLGDAKQTSGGTAASTKSRGIVDQLPIGICIPAITYLPSTVQSLVRSLSRTGLAELVPHTLWVDAHQQVTLNQESHPRGFEGD